MKGVTNMRKLISLLMLLFVTHSFAQDFIVNPQGIVVNPRPEFEVDVRLNKAGEAPVYDVGEAIEISVTVSADAWIYLFNVRSDGQVVQILPNNIDQDGQNNFLRAGQT